MKSLWRPRLNSWPAHPWAPHLVDGWDRSSPASIFRILPVRKNRSPLVRFVKEESIANKIAPSPTCTAAASGPRLIYPFKSQGLPSLLRFPLATDFVSNGSSKQPKCPYLNRHEPNFLLPLLKRDFKLDGLGQSQRLPSP